MAYKKIVTSLLVALLSGVTIIPTYTQAGEPELYFFPKNKWVVNDTGNVAATGGATCTVSNELNNGYVLEMTGSSKGFENISIDFRQSAFKENMKYEIQYTIPGLDRAIVSSRATAASKVSSDISDKSAFAEGLASAGVLDVQIRENTFRIYLTGLKASLPQFDDCVAPAQTFAASKSKNIEDAVLNDIGAVALKDSAPAQELALDEPIDAPAQALAPPPAAVSSAATPSIQASADSAPADPNLRPAPKHKRYTEILAEQLKQESEKYKPAEPEATEAEEATTAVDEGAMVAPIPPKKNITKQSYKSPEAVYNVTKKTVEPVDLTQTEKAVSNLEPASGAAAQSGVANDDFIDMRNKISSMEKELISLREKNEMLDEELKLSLQESEKERLSVSSDNWNLERATMRYNEAERQITRLGRQLQTARATCESEKTELEQMLFDPKLTEQSQLARLAALEKELDSAKSDLYRQQRQYEERIKLLESQLAQ